MKSRGLGRPAKPRGKTSHGSGTESGDRYACHSPRLSRTAAPRSLLPIPQFGGGKVTYLNLTWFFHSRLPLWGRKEARKEGGREFGGERNRRALTSEASLFQRSLFTFWPPVALRRCQQNVSPSSLPALLCGQPELTAFSSALFVARQMSLKEAGGGQVTGAPAWAFAVEHPTVETS